MTTLGECVLLDGVLNGRFTCARHPFAWFRFCALTRARFRGTATLHNSKHRKMRTASQQKWLRRV
jgi:hypothetical protein